MIRVLIVEDDPMVAKFNTHYLEQIKGFKLIAVANSVDAALEIISKQEIDLILLDIFMPGRNGLELLSQIRKAGKNIDVIIVSAACDKENIKKSLSYGAIDYLIKPFDFERFNTALLTHRQRTNFLKEQESFNQEQLDQFILKKEQSIDSTELPKGLDKNTLMLVYDKILQVKDNTFSTEELANTVGISRVTIRKYLDFLNQIGVLEQEVAYGSVGRPVYRYRCVNQNFSIK